MTRLLGARDPEAIGNVLKLLHEDKPDSPYHKFMPNLAGTAAEIAALRDYLSSLVPVGGKGSTPLRGPGGAHPSALPPPRR
jgi:hypothetical protein